MLKAQNLFTTRNRKFLHKKQEAIKEKKMEGGKHEVGTQRRSMREMWRGGSEDNGRLRALSYKAYPIVSLEGVY